jgi:hypothetical protein
LTSREQPLTHIGFVIATTLCAAPLRGLALTRHYAIAKTVATTTTITITTMRIIVIEPEAPLLLASAVDFRVGDRDGAVVEASVSVAVGADVTGVAVGADVTGVALGAAVGVVVVVAVGTTVGAVVSHDAPLTRTTYAAAALHGHTYCDGNSPNTSSPGTNTAVQYVGA